MPTKIKAIANSKATKGFPLVLDARVFGQPNCIGKRIARVAREFNSRPLRSGKTANVRASGLNERSASLVSMGP